jgi:PKD repeat protein
LVLTEVDYLNFVEGQLGSSENPAAFWYVDNINFPASDFSSPLDQTAPVVTLNGADTVTIHVNTSYTELGATAMDCVDGTLTPVVTGSPDTTTIGLYNVMYIATDAAGNSDTVIRTVIIGAQPVADFNWSFPVNACRPQFSDQTLNFPTSWAWTFGDGGISSQRNPLHTFIGNGNYTVCLTSTNSFGTSTQVCKQVAVTGCNVGINELDFAHQISMYPNPTSGEAFINLESDNVPDFTITVYNVLGETVVAPARYKAGTARVELELGSLTNGVYLVKVQSNQGTAVKPLTLTRN